MLKNRGLCLLFAIWTMAAGPFGHLSAESIQGTIIIKRKLTKPRVTAPLSLYQRGPSVDLGQDSTAGLNNDPLAMERERVAIWIEGRAGSAAGLYTMDQKQRRFSPEMLIIPAGSRVSFPNLDPIFHNIFSLSKPKSFDLGNYPEGATRIVTFPVPGIVYVNCHLHPNMAATIVVTPNRWGAIPDASGRFSLHNLPPGKYTIVAWHRAAGFFRQEIEVVPGSGASVEFFIPLGANEPSGVKDSETRAQ